MNSLYTTPHFDTITYRSLADKATMPVHGIRKVNGRLFAQVPGLPHGRPNQIHLVRVMDVEIGHAQAADLVARARANDLIFFESSEDITFRPNAGLELGA